MIPKPNPGEDAFRFQCRAAKLPPWREQFRFAPDRKFRADFCWPEYKIIVEAQGGAFIAGRHVRGQGFTDDCERRSIAAVLGYSIIEATTDQIQSGKALKWTEQALKNRGWK